MLDGDIGVPGLQGDCLGLGAIARTPTPKIDLLETDHFVWGDVSGDVAQRYCLGGRVDHLSVSVEKVVSVAPRSDAGLDIPRQQIHGLSAFVALARSELSDRPRVRIARKVSWGDKAQAIPLNLDAHRVETLGRVL